MIEILQSISSYYGDVHVRAGVDALLKKPGKLPADLGWDEIPAYYRALSAAQRVLIDKAILLEHIWQAAWAAHIPSEWKALRPDDQLQFDAFANPHPDACWNNDWLARCFEWNRRTIYANVGLDAEGVTLGFGAFTRSGAIAAREDVEGFELDTDAGFYWQHSSTALPLGGAPLAVGPFSAAAAVAIAAMRR